MKRLKSEELMATFLQMQGSKAQLQVVLGAVLEVRDLLLAKSRPRSRKRK